MDSERAKEKRREEKGSAVLARVSASEKGDRFRRKVLSLALGSDSGSSSDSSSSSIGKGNGKNTPANHYRKYTGST